MKIKVAIADDHKMFIAGLRLILGFQKQIEIIAECFNGQEVLDVLQKKEIDVLLLDIEMPIMNGYETCKEIRKTNSDIKIIILSMLDEQTGIMRMLEAGANGYMYKNADEDKLITAIETVHSDAYYIEPNAMNILKKYLQKKKDAAKGYDKLDRTILTKREKEILTMIVNGNTNDEIADKLFLSRRTIDTHRQNMLSKLSLKNTASLVKFAIEQKSFLGIK